MEEMTTGARVYRVCVRCGKDSDKDARFCSHCGAPLIASRAAPPTPAIPTADEIGRATAHHLGDRIFGPRIAWADVPGWLKAVLMAAALVFAWWLSSLTR